jgi:DNA-binding ferritin-like protein (Dps family)
MDKNNKNELYEDIKPIIAQLASLFKQIDKMLEDGLITQQQYNDMLGLDLEDEDEI